MARCDWYNLDFAIRYAHGFSQATGETIMSIERFQLGTNAASVYEAQKVPNMFRPLAEAVLARLALKPGDRVIDIACGTGIVARLAAPMVMPGGVVAGADLSRPMLEVARALAETQRYGIDWHLSDVAALPFTDGAFDMAICQQGLQFFPDKPAALAEILRVLAPGGRLALTVWSKPSPLFVAISEAIRQHIGDDAAKVALSPFAFCDAELIGRLIAGAGFIDAEVSKITIDRRLGPAAQSLPREIIGSPAGTPFSKEAPAVQERIVADATALLQPYAQGEGLVIPQETSLFEARAG